VVVAFRFRQRIRFTKGVRLYFGSKVISLSLGGRGRTMSIRYKAEDFWR